MQIVHYVPSTNSKKPGFAPDPPSTQRGPITPSSSQSSVSTEHGPQRKSKCRVPLCRDRFCKLKSHELYRPRTSAQASKDRALSSIVHNRHDGYLQVDGWQGNPKVLDYAFALPVPNNSSPTLQYFFRHFFDSVFDRLALLFRGPSYAANAEPYKKQMLLTALRDKVYCLGLVMQAHTDIASAKLISTESRQSLFLYAQTVGVFRAQISDLLSQKPSVHTQFQNELAMLNVCILLAYDSLYRRRESLRMHWEGLQSLVSLRGGIGCVTIALPYVIHVDCMCAVFLGQMPSFNIETADYLENNDPQYTRPSWGIYGHELVALYENDPYTFDLEVLEHCINASSLVELWELKHMTISHAFENAPEHPFLSSHTSSEYSHYLRRRIDRKFTVLNAKALKYGTSLSSQDTCLLLATRIVEYQVSWSNYYPMNAKMHCEQIAQMLQDHGDDIDVIWNGLEHVLRYILWSTLVSSHQSFAGRAWILQTLYDQLMVEYGGVLFDDDDDDDEQEEEEIEDCVKEHEISEQWESEELENMAGFVWSQVAFLAPFRSVCAELVDIARNDFVQSGSY